MQRDVWYTPRAGSLRRLTRRTEHLAAPGAGEVRVRVHAVGLNFADVFACLGLYSAAPRGAFVPGLECAGVVEAVGETGTRDTARQGAAPVCVGDRVMALTRFGAYATALNVPAAALWPAPDGWTFAQAAAWPVNALTAWYGLLRLGDARRGEVVLVQSAAGGVGLSALAVLDAIGARVVAAVGSDRKREFLLRERGIAPDGVVVRDARRFGAQLDAALGSAGRTGFDVVFDAVAGPWFAPAYDRLSAEGRYVLYGAADFMPHRPTPGYARLAWKYLRRPRLDPLAMIAQNRSVMAFNLIWLWNAIERLSAALEDASRLVAAPHIGRRFDFDDAPEALRFLQSGESVGKVVLGVHPDGPEQAA